MNVRHANLSIWRSFLLLAAAVWLCFPGKVEAKPKPDTLIFLLADVELPEKAPASLETKIRKQFAKQVDDHPRLLSAIPKEAPALDDSNPDRRGNKAFRAYMKKHHMRAYRVTIQVTRYDVASNPNERKPGHLLSAFLGFHMFGEALPFRTMAFSADGSAKIAIEVGKKIRAKDKEFVLDDTIKLTLEQAVASSLDKLNAAKKKPRERRSRKKR